jgi:response regulator RpfG family c-di-GMP phosphodiesterase
VYFASSGLLLFSLFAWLISYLKQKTKISPLWMRIGTVLCGIHILMALTIPFHRLLSYIDENNCYQRGDLFLLTQICPYIVYLMAVALLIIKRKEFLKRELCCLVIFVAIPVFAEIIQVVTYTIAALNVSISFGLMLILFFVQSQREREQDKQINSLIKNENVKLNEMQKIQENLSEQLIDVLCGTVEAKDRYTRGHSMRVAQYAREIMYRMGGDEKAQQEVYFIGVLHDVGKISIPDEIINKNTRLTDDEYAQIKLHTIAGYQILQSVNVIPDLAVGARWHHERYDGTGYPNGLSGENIPLIARIISVADAYDAMTSNRSYRTVMPQSAVREEIVKGMGTQFDPKIAQIMLDIIDEDIEYEMKQVNENKTINILMIDDDEISHEIVQQALLGENCQLTSAYNGEEGIKHMMQTKFDLCLLDMEMPGMNGFEVLDWIRANIRKLKVIFLSGEKDIAAIQRSISLGARDYITKPVDMLVLKETINSVFEH